MDMVRHRRFDVYLAVLDPAQGAEINKTRPCVIVSPDESNDGLRTVVIAPLTTAWHDYPSRVRVRFQGRDGEVAIDQVRSLDKRRLLRRLGAVPDEAAQRLRAALVEFFS
jgi:mRNA interferase MazF